jgi:hypothetical protein
MKNMKNEAMEPGSWRGTNGWNRPAFARLRRGKGSAYATRLPPSLGSSRLRWELRRGKHGGTRWRGGRERGGAGFVHLTSGAAAAGHGPALRGGSGANLPRQARCRALDRPLEPEPRPEEIWFAATLHENAGGKMEKRRIRDDFPGRESRSRCPLPPGRTGKLPISPMPTPAAGL